MSTSKKGQYVISAADWTSAGRSHDLESVVTKAREATGKKVPAILVGEPDGMNRAPRWSPLYSVRLKNGKTTASFDLYGYNSKESAISAGYRRARKSAGRLTLTAVVLEWTAGNII